jgi:hypothetical protein
MAWHFCSQGSTSKMEHIQELALRFIYNDYQCSYEDLLHRANLPTLEIKRLRTMAIECFKIIHDLSPNCLLDLVTLKNSSFSVRYSNILDVPRVRTSTYGKKSFKYKTNTIPILMHQMRISTNQVSSVVLMPKKLEIRKIVKYASAVLWNELPERLRIESNLTHFKSPISTWNGKTCKCTACLIQLFVFCFRSFEFKYVMHDALF